MVAVLQCRHLGAKAKRGKGKMFRGKGLAKKRKRGAGKSFRGKGLAGKTFAQMDKLRDLAKGRTTQKHTAATFKRLAARQIKWKAFLDGPPAAGKRQLVKC